MQNHKQKLAIFGSRKILSIMLMFWWILVFGVYFWIAHVGLDPDFGWHIRLGDMMRSTGFSDTDPFSYTMPSYPHVDHEWLTHVTWSFLYEWGGKVLLAILYTVLALGSLVVVVPRMLYLYAVIPWIFTTGALLSRFGVRPQVIGWFLLAVTIRILTESKKHPKLKWTLPLIFVLWANLHASFVFGVMLVGIYFLSKSMEVRRVDKIAALLLFASFFSTMINPYGYKMWQEVLGQAGSTDLKLHIIEWRWIFEGVEFSFWGLSVLSGVLMFRYWRRLPRWLTFGQLVFFGLAVHASRQAPLSSLFSIVICSGGGFMFLQELSKNRWQRERAKTALIIMICVALTVSLKDGLPAFQGWLNWSEEKYYPVDALNFLKTQKIEGEILADYAWGGYLIWKYPEKKVFIDGRMPAYKWNAPEGESDNAFVEYLALVNDLRVYEITSKYNIRYILLPASGSQAIQSSKKVHKFYGENINNSLLLLHYELKSSGWKVVHEDGVSELYFNPEAY